MANMGGKKDWRRAYRSPPADSARAIRSDFMARLWELLEPLELTERALAWLAERGLNPELAHALGFRDWRPAMTRFKQMIEALPPPERVATGFFTNGGHMWWPLCDEHRAIQFLKREVSSSETMPIHAEGLVAPAWEADAAHPMGWLWQLYKPISKSPADNCMRQLSAEQPTLLGLNSGRSDLPLPGRHENLLIGEGPIDWLCLAQAAAGKAAVMGMLRTIDHWHEDWTPWLAGAKRIALVLPERKGYAEKVFEAMKASAAQHFGADWAEDRLSLTALTGEDECQALLKRGELPGMVDGLI